MKNFTLLFFIILSYLLSFAQPANDACTNPTLINNVNNFCSANGAGTTVNATDDASTGTTYSAPTCWGTGAVNDVYFSFVAIATDVTIVINGNQGSPSGGTLNRPQVALYTGGCGGSELVCASAPSGQNIVQIYRGGLTIGQTYLIRVDGFNTNKGTFQYCINNYNPVPTPQSDCPTAVVLCDKSNFTVQSVIGAGSNATEMNGAACFEYDIFTGNVETNSSWYVFTFANAGTFTFNLVPSNPDDDIDFAVYRLPNGIGNCNGKVTSRCMASSCTGATGLNASSTDTEEPPGCSFPQNNFVSQLNVTAGQTYTIAINNFTSTGNGFNISFGGTAQIQGPVAIINDNDADDKICVGEAITYVDASTAPPAGSLVSWIWNFGVGATPAIFSGTTPPPITYSTAGIKTVTLTIKSDKGCLVTSTRSITVNGVAASVSIIANQNNVCANTNITFTATPINGGTNPSYQWYKNGVIIPFANGVTYNTNSLLNNDKISVVMTSNALCATGSPSTSNEITMTITPGTPVSVSIAINNNNICSGTSVTFTATPSSTTLSPTYKWYKNGVLISGVTGAIYSSNSLANNDVITVEMISNVACISGSPATSNAIVMIVKPTPIVTVNSPSICNGNSTTLTANGATTYLWSTGETGNTISVNPTSTTTYTVVGTTAGCSSASISSLVTVTAIPVITVNSPTICNGNSTTLTAIGATTYSWSNGLTGNTITVSPTTTTSYTVIGTTNTCPSLPKTATVTVNAVPVVTVNSPTICSGNSTTLTATGATTYSWSNGSTGNTITVNPTTTTNYTVIGTTNTCPSLPKTAIVTVNTTPIVTVNSPSICNGNSGTLTATGATTYTWSNGSIGNTITVSPTATTSYTVIGTTNTCPSLPKIATVTVTPIPVVTVNSPTICNGNSTTLTATGATTYSWSNGSTGNTITVSPNTTTSYTVIGTTNTCPSSPKTATVTVNPKPIITVTNDTICNGETTVLTASGATSYSWSTGETGASISVNPSITTTYTVVGTTLNCPSNAKSGKVVVNQIPTVLVSPVTICVGDTGILTASGATTYLWNTGETSASISVSPNVTVSYTVVGNKSGCNSLPVNTIVTVNPIPIVNVNSPTICSGKQATLTASGATNYTWNTGANSNSIIVNPVSNTTYTVIGTSLNCPSRPANAIVTVNATPIITVNSETICEGESVTLTANGANTYSWNTGATSASILVNPVITTTYTVTGTTLNCPSLPIKSIVTVSPLLTPAVNIVASKNNICSGAPIIFTATTTGTGTTPNYQWFLNSIPVGTNNKLFTSSTLNNGDNVYVEISTTFRCSQPKTAQSNVVTVIVNKINYTKPSLTYCKNDSALVDSTNMQIITSPNTPFNIIWKNGADITNDSVINYWIKNTASINLPFTIEYGNNCSVNDVINVIVKPLPVINAVVDIPRAKYEVEVQLDVVTNQTLSYNWIPISNVNIDTIKNPTSVITESTLFIVYVEDKKTTCKIIDSIYVELIDECTIDFMFVPTGFSPNNDGINDCFSILSPPKLTNFSMFIFDRWSEKVFETYSEKECWNGTYKGSEAPTDSYSYIITYTCYNGKLLSKKGTISVVR